MNLARFTFPVTRATCCTKARGQSCKTDKRECVRVQSRAILAATSSSE